MKLNEKIPIVTVAGSKISPQIVDAQLAVIKRLLLPHGFVHVRIKSDDHAGALNQVMQGLKDLARPVVILDVDCIPLSTGIVLEGMEWAERGELVGCAQSAAHIDAREPYVGPFYWIGIPSCTRFLDFRATEHADVGQRVSRMWPRARGFLWPRKCRQPLWRVHDGQQWHTFGHGTYYGDHENRTGVFHEFCSRDAGEHVQAFVDACEEVLHAA